MTAANFPTIAAFIFSQEGGFSDNPADPGGATMDGVTLATYRRFIPNATVDDLKAIPGFASMFILWLDYFRPVRGDDLPGGIDLMVADFGFNAGPRWSIALLQEAVGVDPDGDLGPVSMAAIAAADPVHLLSILHDAQMTYYRGLATFATFGDGWTRRTDARLVAALKLTGVTGA
jgi:lysozyme family protein